MRLYGIDLLRGIAAFGIVGCHLILAPRAPAADWLTHFCDMNVAVFGVIAGFFTRVSLDDCASHDILRRLKRLLPTYAVWTLVFLAASAVFKIAAHDDLGQYANPGFWASVVFFGGSSAHLWFLAVLAYTQVLALLLLHRKLPSRVAAVIGLAGIALSVSVKGWWGWYFFRLFGFVWIGIAVREIHWGDWKLFGSLTLAGLMAHVAFIGMVPAFFRDLFVAVPLVLFAARLPMPITGGGVSVRAVLGRDKHGSLSSTSALDEVWMACRDAALRCAVWSWRRPVRLGLLLGDSPHDHGYGTAEPECRQVLFMNVAHE